VKAASWQLLVEEFATVFPDSRTLLRLANSRAPTAPRLGWPATVRCVWRPPYGPELNPSARVWHDLTEDLAWQQCRDRDAPQVDVADVLQADNAPMLQACTGYAYLVDAINALGP
jgi:putative transposase